LTIAPAAIGFLLEAAASSVELMAVQAISSESAVIFGTELPNCLIREPALAAFAFFR
jgi:hypothetical protein